MGRGGQPRRPADRASAPQMKRAPRSQAQRAQAGRARGVLLLSGFEPFGGERSNPSWEVAAQLDGREIGGLGGEGGKLPGSPPPAGGPRAAAVWPFAPPPGPRRGVRNGQAPSMTLEMMTAAVEGAAAATAGMLAHAPQARARASRKRR